MVSKQAEELSSCSGWQFGFLVSDMTLYKSGPIPSVTESVNLLDLPGVKCIDWKGESISTIPFSNQKSAFSFISNNFKGSLKMAQSFDITRVCLYW